MPDALTAAHTGYRELNTPPSGLRYNDPPALLPKFCSGSLHYPTGRPKTGVQMIGPSLQRSAPLYFALHVIGGYILLPLLTATLLLSKRVKRHPTVVNFCVTWIIYSVSYSLLLLYGGWRRPAGELAGLCTVQLSMIYGSDVMVAAANLTVAIQIWSTFYVPCAPLRVSRYSRFVRPVITLMSPYIVFLAFSVVGLHEAQLHSHAINVDNGIYCAMDLRTFSRFTLPVACGILLLTASVFEVTVIIRCYLTWRTAKVVCPEAYIKSPSLSPCLRVRKRRGKFLAYSWATLGACVFNLSAYGSTSVYPYFVQATLPLVAFIVFGMQKDIALVWLSCLKKAASAFSKEATSLDADLCPSRELQSTAGNEVDARMSTADKCSEAVSEV